MEIPTHFQEAMIFRNNFCMVKCICVRAPSLPRLATVLVLEAGGKPSTWFPPGGLVEPTFPRQFSRDHMKMEF